MYVCSHILNIYIYISPVPVDGVAGGGGGGAQESGRTSQVYVGAVERDLHPHVLPLSNIAHINQYRPPPTAPITGQGGRGVLEGSEASANVHISAWPAAPGAPSAPDMPASSPSTSIQV